MPDARYVSGEPDGFFVEDCFLEAIVRCDRGSYNFEILNRERGRLFLKGKLELERLCVRYKNTRNIKKVGTDFLNIASFDIEFEGTDQEGFCIYRKVRNNRNLFRVEFSSDKLDDEGCRSLENWGYFTKSGRFENAE